VLDLLLRGHHGGDAANVLNNQGRTPLMEAIRMRDTAAVMALARMTNVNIADVEGKTALHHAIQMQDSMYVDVLLERGADISMRDVKGNTALALACFWHDSEDDFTLRTSMLFQLYRYVVAYGEQSNMI